MRYRTLLLTIAGAAVATACHSSPPAETAPAQPDTPPPVVAAQPVFNQDSADAVARARADSVERVRLAEEAREAAADSVERVRVAEARSTEIRNELGVMVHFDVGQAQLQADGREALDRKVAILNANPSVRLKITGACDDRGSSRYNEELGERRAAAVSKYLVGKGIDVARLDRVSTGETAPIDAGDTEAAWAQNRRAEFAIVSGDAVLAMN
jgi:peptidoglycan-associated lipoprotein